MLRDTYNDSGHSHPLPPPPPPPEPFLTRFARSRDMPADNPATPLPLIALPNPLSLALLQETTPPSIPPRPHCRHFRS